MQHAQIGAQLLFRCALGGGADDESAADLAALVNQNALQALTLFVGGDFAADADMRDRGHEDQKAPRQRDVRGDARALLAIGSLAICTRISWPGLSRSLMMGRSDICAERRDGSAALPVPLAVRAACRTATAITATAALRIAVAALLASAPAAGWPTAGVGFFLFVLVVRSPSKFNWMRWSRCASCSISPRSPVRIW